VRKRARELARVFPGPGDPVAWDHYAAPGLEVKLGLRPRGNACPHRFRQAIHDLNSGPFIRFLETATGIEHLLPDPHLSGGGIHLSRHGGHLGVHADFQLARAAAGAPAPEPADLSDAGLAPRVRRRAGVVELRPARSASASWNPTSIAPCCSRRARTHSMATRIRGRRPMDIYRQSIALLLLHNEPADDEVRPAHSTLYKGYNV
jgi:hypothetical protein